jgi:hypothetical protein
LSGQTRGHFCLSTGRTGLAPVPRCGRKHPAAIPVGSTRRGRVVPLVPRCYNAR